MVLQRILLVSFAVLFLAGCVAPLSRTSVIRSGFSFEGGGGLSLYRGSGFVRDTSTLLGYRAQLQDLNAGPYGMARASYGYQGKYGGDLTLTAGYGPPILPGDSLWGGWLHVAIAGKLRPWRSNNLFFAEFGYPQLAVGWVGGFPMNRPEQWSLAVKAGSGIDSIPLQITNEELNRILNYLIPPTMLQFNIARNISARAGRRSIRVSPSLGVGLGLNWDPLAAPRMSHILAGVTVGQ